MNIKTNITNLAWITPFLGFLLGYFILSGFFGKKDVLVPNITGKTIQESLRILSQNSLKLTLLKEIDVLDLPQGTILSQNPAKDFKIKSGQSVFVTVSKKPTTQITPNFFNVSYSKINKIISKQNLKTEIHWLESYLPSKNLIAQYPLPGDSLDNKKLILYLSKGSCNFFIVPNFKGCSLSNLREAIDDSNVTLELFYKNTDYSYKSEDEIFVFDQKPIAGSIVDLSKKLYLQILVE